MDRAFKVRLLVDLTKYNPLLKPGIEGVTVGRYGMWSKASDRFIGVSFPGVGTLDVLWESLEIVDPEYLEEEKKREEEKWRALKNATDVKKVIGIKGQLKGVSYRCVNSRGHSYHMHSRVHSKNRSDMEKLLAFFSENNVPVTVEKEDVAKRSTTFAGPISRSTRARKKPRIS